MHYFSDPLLLVGFTGSLLVLSAFFLNQTSRLTVQSPVYDWMNVLGALCLVVYAFHASVWPFVLTNSVWFLVSFRDVTVSFFKR